MNNTKEEILNKCHLDFVTEKGVSSINTKNFPEAYKTQALKAMDDLKKVVNDAFKAIAQTQDTGVVMLTGQQTYLEFSAYKSEPKSEEQISREQQIEGYYQIISMATTLKQLEMHRGNIEKINDEALTREFNNKLKELQ